MIISRGRKYIFVHIPKTGGTSLASALEDRAMRGDILIGDTEKAKKRKRRVTKLQEQASGRLWKHSTLADIEGVVTQQEMSRFFCFTFVRNPWNRVVSYYNWLRTQSFDHTAVRLAQMLSFENFVKHPHTVQSLQAWPYTRYLTGSDGIEYGDLYIRLEHWRPDMEMLAEHLGFVPGIGHMNRSVRHPDYRTYYTDETAELIGRVCAQDIRRFGYRY